MIFQTYVPNFGYSLIEVGGMLIGLLIILLFSLNLFYKDKKTTKSIVKKGSLVTCLISFGIIFGIRVLFEVLGLFSPIFRIFNEDLLFFALMVTVFYFLHKPLINKYGFSRISREDDSAYLNFRKFFFYLMVVTWVAAAFFLSIPILNIPMETPDVFNLGILWTFATLAIDFFITTIVNRSLPTDKRVAKSIIKSSMYYSGLIVFGLWSFQQIIFELYLNRWLGIVIFKQDIRVTILVVSGLYIIFFFNLLKTKFLPESSEKSSKRVQQLLQLELEKQIGNNNETESILEYQDSTPDTKRGEGSIRLPEGISFKFYIYFIKKFNKSNLSDEEIVVSKRIFDNKFNTILTALLWGVMILTYAISILLRPNLIAEVLFLSVSCAFFLVLGDFFLILLFDRMNSVHNRVPKMLLRGSILLGGIITFWIWIGPFFIIYLYLFVWLNDPFIMFITNVVLLSTILFFVGSRIVRWYAGSVKMWNKSKKKAARISLAWLIINLPLRLFLVLETLLISLALLVPLTLGWIAVLSDLLITGINIVIGTVLVLKLYKRKFLDSLRFAIGTQIIMLMITIALKHLKVGDLVGGGIFGFFQNIFSIMFFTIHDIRISMFVATGIYILSVFVSLRIKFTPDTSKTVMEKFRKALKDIEEIDLPTSVGNGNKIILDVKNLTTYFNTEEGIVKAVEGVSFQIKEGETLGLVGETGCGKSVTALSILKLVRPPGEIKSGQVFFEGEDLHQKSDDEFLRYRGSKITMIFQDPLNSLNPVFKIGDQISEVYQLHLEDELLVEAVKKNTSIYSVARKRSQKMLKDLNIPTPRLIFDRYPHELSGGMRQRVQIAMGLACSPKLLIADEPTTALDVTIQNQILKLMKDLKKKYNTSILFITHDLGIISKMCDRVAVMYCGFIVEYGDIEKLFRTPYHPYARGLIAAVPVVGKRRKILDVIPGTVPNLIYPPSGCRFHPRCQYCFEPCDSEIPRSLEIEPEYFVACHLYDPQYKDLAEISIKKAESQIIEK